MSMRHTIPMIIVALLTLSGCHSSRNATKDDIYTERRDRDAPKDATSVDSRRKAIVDEARNWLGTKYRYGGNDRKGVDCSGMVTQIYLKVANLKLPRNSAQQQQFCQRISKDELAEGDLVFFATGRDKSRVSHVGIYIGDDRMIHASSSQGVIISNLNERYYTRHYHSSGYVAGIFADKTATKTEAGKKSTPKPAAEISINDLSKLTQKDSTNLNQALDQKIDSIYSTWLE